MSAPGMRILAVVPSYRPQASTGAFITSREYVRHLAASGHTVHVITTGRETGLPRVEDGVSVWPVGHWWHGLREARPDLVISHHNDRHAGRLLAQLRAVPHLLMVHGMAHANRHLGAPDLAWFPSHACRDFYPTYRGRSLVLAPPIEPDRYRTTPGRLVTVSGTTVAKGGDILAQVAERMPGTEFLAVRTPFQRSVDIALPNVEVIDRTDPREVYARTRILLMPSTTESYGRAGVEAMVSGIPVVAAPLPGLREAIGDAARYVPRNDVDAWVREIRRLSDPDTYAAASAAAVAHTAGLDYVANLRAFEAACRETARPQAAASTRRRPRVPRRTAVAWVHFGVPYRRAGSETMLHTMMRALHEDGVEVEVICSDMPEAPLTWDVDGVRYRRLPRRAAEATIHAARPNIVVTHHDHAERAISLSKAIRAKSVLLVHSDFDIAARPLLRRPDLVVYNTDWVRVALASRYRHATQARSIVVHPPVVPGEHHTPTTGDRVTLVNLNRDKGVETWRAVAHLLPDLPFLGVTGAHGEQVPDPVPPNADIVPQTSNMRRDVWARTRVLLMPSVYESFGMAAVEALASGIPVIAHPTPGLREALGDAAVFVDRGDTDAWAAAVRDLYPDGERRAAASAAARARSAALADQSAAEMTRWVQAIRGL